MRLIDADKFKEFISKLPKFQNGHSKSHDEALIMHFIDGQPTAFDLESVIEQLEERINIYKELGSNEPIVDVAIKEIQRDLEIFNYAANVNKGGKNE